jgi:hypothetical protein
MTSINVEDIPVKSSLLKNKNSPIDYSEILKSEINDHTPQKWERVTNNNDDTDKNKKLRSLNLKNYNPAAQYKRDTKPQQRDTKTTTTLAKKKI